MNIDFIAGWIHGSLITLALIIGWHLLRKKR